MKMARLLADEGAELRHAEIMELDVKRRLESPYDAMFRNILKFADFRADAHFNSQSRKSAPQISGGK